MADRNKPSVGGEALLEGVMMRGKSDIAIAIRKPDGEILVERQPLRTLSQKYSIVNLPIIRGVVSMVESMVTGIKALMYSAEFIEVDDEIPEPQEKPGKKKKDDGKISGVWLVVSVIAALIFGIGLFMVIPYLISRLPLWIFGDAAGFTTTITFMNITEGIIRIALFVLYIILINRIKDVKRVFQYHGAEHKTIYCYEKDEELTVENARKYSTRHPRCGTAFLFIVMIISIFMFSIIGKHAVWVSVILRLVLIPLIAGISYEIIKWAGKSDNWLTRTISWPGMAMQRFTTQEPDDGQLEVAIAALKNVIYTEEELAEETARNAPAVIEEPDVEETGTGEAGEAEAKPESEIV